MSDAVLIEIVGGFITIATLITTAVINSIQNKRIAKNVAEYHKEVNGKMGKLLETTEDLGKKAGILQEKADQAKRDDQKG